jgi:hypothetical protein
MPFYTGYNYPAAMVLSCLHVQLPLIPMMGDTYPNQGFLDVWSNAEVGPKMWSVFQQPQFFGRAWQGMLSKLTKQGCDKAKRTDFLSSGKFEHVDNVETPKNIGNMCVNPDKKHQQLREYVAKEYMDKFAHFFTREFFITKCFEVLNQEALPE